MAEFLTRMGGQAGGNGRFIARNFLLDETVSNERFQSYLGSGGVASHSEMGDWKSAHESYLRDRVARPFDAEVRIDRFVQLDMRDPDVCPETFQSIDPRSSYHQAESSLDLIRVESLPFIERRSGVPAAELKSWAKDVIQNPGNSNSGSYAGLDAAIALWRDSLETRPTFATFWEHVRHLWEPDDQPEWADDLRDWLGLAHLDPEARSIPEIDIIVFRYPVSSLPRLIGSGGNTFRPLVQPCVLDGNFNEAFCPAPRGADTGFTVALNEKCEPVRPEIVHPNARFSASHVWRVGAIRRRIDTEQIAKSRCWHLELLRDRCERADYANKTDADLKP